MGHYTAQSGDYLGMHDQYAKKDRRSRRGRVFSYVLLGILSVATAVVVFPALTK